MGRKQRRALAALGLAVTLAGHIDWELLNADGSVARSGSQPNMILNQGLDQFMTNSGHNGTYEPWRSYLAAGTGSTAPAYTQTSLVAEVARSNATGGFTSSQSYAIDNTAGTITGTFVMPRVITFAASYNLQEIGFAAASTGNLVIRELLRDTQTQNPVTISVQSGQQLKVTHTLTIVLPWKTGLSQTFTLTGYGSVTGNATFYGVNLDGNFISNFFGGTVNPSSASISLRALTNANDGSPNAAGGTVGTDANAPGVSGSSANAYTAGTYTRTRTFVFATNMANYNHYGWATNIGQYANSLDSGWKFSLTNPASIPKDNTKRITLDFAMSVARA